ncbi:MAG: hypothetical protein UT55_C0077G0009, partial [Candidatus Peregrinibacteria bacterium GW2011_GWE2_39_6]
APPTPSIKTSNAAPLREGTIYVNNSTDSIFDSIAVAGADSASNPIPVANYKLYANGESFKITSLSLAKGDKTNEKAVEAVVIHYPTSLSAPTNLNGAASAVLKNGVATFSNLNFMIPASTGDEKAVTLKVFAITNNIGQGTNSGDQIELDFVKNAFLATGQTSKVSVTPDSPRLKVPDNKLYSNQVALYQSLPVYKEDFSSSFSPCAQNGKLTAYEATTPIYCFSVVANNAGDVALYKVTFDVEETGLNLSSLQQANGFNITEYDYTGDKIVGGKALGTGTWDSTSKQVTIVFEEERIISRGATRYYALNAPLIYQSSSQEATVSTRLIQENAKEHSANNYAANVPGGIVWSDISAPGHSPTNTADWTNGYRAYYLPTANLDLLCPANDSSCRVSSTQKVLN